MRDLSAKQRKFLRDAIRTHLGTLYGAKEDNCPPHRLSEIRKEIKALMGLKELFPAKWHPKAPMNETALFEDNNGGDIIEIRKNNDGTFSFLTGWQCVVFLQKTGTISELSKWFAEIDETLQKAKP